MMDIHRVHDTVMMTGGGAFVKVCQTEPDRFLQSPTGGLQARALVDYPRIVIWIFEATVASILDDNFPDLKILPVQIGPINTTCC